MRAENKDLLARLAFSEDARARATYDVMRAWTIQKACFDAQKTAESQLKSCQNMIYAKDKELTEALNELAKAHGLLAKLGAPGYAEPLGDDRDRVDKVGREPHSLAAELYLLACLRIECLSSELIELAANHTPSLPNSSGKMIVEESCSFGTRETEMMKRIPQMPVLDSLGPKHEAAIKWQIVYKSFQTRRKPADCAVLIEQWSVEAIGFCRTQA
ncbi:hypothetical protein Fot_25063 [Forsythia ovata]|uniref:Uncharacterized protein n=1 Tax=Forsythia ovata TaxID=205694 RepID=A0ABD1U828_9LAMI